MYYNTQIIELNIFFWEKKDNCISMSISKNYMGHLPHSTINELCNKRILHSFAFGNTCNFK